MGNRKRNGTFSGIIIETANLLSVSSSCYYLILTSGPSARMALGPLIFLLTIVSS
jgi:hypothetical protein